MNDTLRLRLTGALLGLALAGAALSVWTLARGKGELYPFYTWRLYDEPLGNKAQWQEYRLYARQKPDGSWQRVAIKDLPAYNHLDQQYTLTSLTQDALAATADAEQQAKGSAPPGSLPLRRLRAFAETVAPGAAAYAVHRETYDPLRIAAAPDSFAHAPVIRF